MAGLTEPQLRALAGDVRYELDMLRATAARLAHQTGALPDDIRHALIESFLIHHRNLVDFLSPREKTYRSDATAAQYLGRHFKDRLQAPLAERSNIDKRLAHLSIDRRSPDNRGWSYLEMLRQLEEAWADFIENLQSEFPERVAWFNPPDATTD